MKNVEFQSKKTKLQAFLLVHDPAKLFCLLYLKYGLCSDDFFISFINQIMFNDFCHYTLLYKEQIYNISLKEYLKKMYNYEKSKNLISKINKHNQSYFRFFSKPIFTDFYYNKFLGDYYDDKAELFYINDYSGKKNTKLLKENELKNAVNYNISSFDNDTQIDTIFNKRMKNMIDNNLDSKDITITLSENKKNELDNSNKNVSYESLKTIIDYLVTKKSKIIDSNQNELSEKKILRKFENENTKHDIDKKLKLDTSLKNNNNSQNNNKENSKNQENKIKYFNSSTNNKKQNPQIKSIENNNYGKEQKEFNQINKKDNYIELNNPMIINDKSLNAYNLKNFSPLYKKPKLKIKNKLEISKKAPYKNQISILNSLKKPQNTSKFNFYSPQNNKVKYIFNNIGTSLSKKAENPGQNKENSNFILMNIYKKSELPSIHKENSVKKVNNNSELLLSDKRATKETILNIYPFKNSNFRIIKKSQMSKINSPPRINFNKISLDLKSINPSKKISNFSQDKILDKNKNIININVEKKKFNYIKNKKKLRPSYSMNKEVESFNSDIKTIEINNKVNKNLSRNSINKNVNIKSTTKYILKGNKKGNNSIKHKKIIFPNN